MQSIKVALYSLTLLTISVVHGQVIPGDGRLVLYTLDRTQGKYVLSMNFVSLGKENISDVVIGDTFAVQPNGPVCFVVMSNAYILQTTSIDHPTNGVKQLTMSVGTYKMPFRENTKLLFKNSVVELPKANIDASVETNVTTYEGDDALRQLKKMGLGPPDDMDTEKAVGH